MTPDHADLIDRLTRLSVQALCGFRTIARLEEAETLKEAIRVIEGVSSSSVPVRASGEPQKLIDEMVKKRFGAVHLLRSQAERDAANGYKASLEKLAKASASPSDDGVRQPQDPPA